MGDDDELAWLPMLASVCAERRSWSRGECGDEWLAKSEVKLREANASLSVQAAALWLAARAWVVSATGASTSSTQHKPSGSLSAAQRLALDGGVCAPGTVCAALLCDTADPIAKTATACVWKAEFAVFRSQFS